MRSLMICLSLAAGAPALAQPVYRGGIDLVHFGVTVVDKKGGLVANLRAADFEIYEEGRKQTLEHFAAGALEDVQRPPLHVALLFDTSGSMEQDISLSRSAAIKFLNTLHMAEDITLVDFDTEVRVARYGQADFPRLVERIRNRKPDGWTALYDALGVYLDGAHAQDGRKVLVIYTDGGDTRSAMSYSDLVDLLKASDITAYVVGFLEHQSTTVRLDQRLRLLQVAELTGGQAFFPSSLKMLDGVFEQVLAEISAQYSLGFTSTDKRTDGAWRKVEIKLTRPDLKGAKIRTRKGYFAPYKENSSK